MKHILFLTAVMLMVSACTTSYQATGYDDVYYTPSSQPAVVKHTVTVKTTEQNMAAVPDTGYYDNQQYASGNNTYPDTNYAASQYYDESYEARINRFDEPYVSTSYYLSLIHI